MGILTARRTESVKFSEFMSGEYKDSREAKKRNTRQMKRVLKNVAVSSIVMTAGKVVVPAAAVSIPLVMIAGKAMAAAAGQGVPVGEVIEVGAIPQAVKSKIVHAFDPLVDLLISLSLPIASVMLTAGALMVMINQKEKGYGLIFSGCTGYILVQLSPLFIDLLAGVGSAI